MASLLESEKYKQQAKETKNWHVYITKVADRGRWRVVQNRQQPAENVKAGNREPTRSQEHPENLYCK
jgi:hypothetical protein